MQYLIYDLGTRFVKRWGRASSLGEAEAQVAAGEGLLFSFSPTDIKEWSRVDQDGFIVEDTPTKKRIEKEKKDRAKAAKDAKLKRFNRLNALKNSPTATPNEKLLAEVILEVIS